MNLSRRALLHGALTTGTYALTCSPLVANAAASPGLPTVDHELLLLAAQWDPVKHGSNQVPHAGPSVLAVERALVAKGLLDPKYADGYFGTTTISAYAAYQRSLGYVGLAANGLPGQASLQTLGKGRFAVTNPVAIGQRITFRGVPLTTRTRDMLLAAEKLAGFTFALDQGSYSPGVDPTSKGTHDGGGAVDVHAVNLTTTQRTAACAAMRKVGFAAWVRNPSQDNWPWHIHGIAILDTDLAPLAQNQVGKYYEGRNALRSNLPDDGPAITKTSWEAYQRTRK